MEIFVKEWRNALVSMTAEEFHTNVTSEVITLREKSKNSRDIFDAHWKEIDNDCVRFGFFMFFFIT